MADTSDPGVPLVFTTIFTAAITSATFEHRAISRGYLSIIAL
jgi:hypothetical protein